MAKNKVRKFRHSDDDERFDSPSIVEVDDDARAPRLPKSRKEIAEDRKRLKAGEFWSDICWEDQLPSE
jgi:hypothetical protein